MRRVRPGETPRFGSVWSWHETGTPLLALRLVKGPRRAYMLAALNLKDGSIVDAQPGNIGMYWTAGALVGVGPVLDEWYCHEEAPEPSGLTIAWNAAGIFKVVE